MDVDGGPREVYRQGMEEAMQVAAQSPEGLPEEVDIQSLCDLQKVLRDKKGQFQSLMQYQVTWVLQEHGHHLLFISPPGSGKTLPFQVAMSIWPENVHAILYEQMKHWLTASGLSASVISKETLSPSSGTAMKNVLELPNINMLLMTGTAPLLYMGELWSKLDLFPEQMIQFQTLCAPSIHQPNIQYQTLYANSASSHNTRALVAIVESLEHGLLPGQCRAVFFNSKEYCKRFATEIGALGEDLKMRGTNSLGSTACMKCLLIRDYVYGRFMGSSLMGRMWIVAHCKIDIQSCLHVLAVWLKGLERICFKGEYLMKSGKIQDLGQDMHLMETIQGMWQFKIRDYCPRYQWVFRLGKESQLDECQNNRSIWTLCFQSWEHSKMSNAFHADVVVPIAWIVRSNRSLLGCLAQYMGHPELEKPKNFDRWLSCLDEGQKKVTVASTYLIIWFYQKHHQSSGFPAV
ncbi:hypothetical protein BS47DRAFT_1368515 [Hydnum rufescens UP504]|uniref:Uncharacterized protein n=1 Tax=Hydnum rufescens UP504 TaxID=1448309 RepID=A0A9P6DNN0_9AGAM|nr:hypothetical protein BS47DRAFT_1368515 [Hydnum rufescens UP504]